MRSIDLLCPCSTPNTTEELHESSDNTLLEGINATLKEVANNIAESNTDVKNALSIFFQAKHHSLQIFLLLDWHEPIL